MLRVGLKDFQGQMPSVLRGLPLILVEYDPGREFFELGYDFEA